MDQVTHGVRSIFSHAAVYNIFQRLLGSHRAKTRFIEEYVHPFPEAKVLDIGCGTGAILDYLPQNIDYIGIDSNPNYIAYAMKQYGHRGRFVCERVSEATVTKADKFDIVLAMAILHHLNDGEAFALFAIAHECLKPGATIVTFDNVYVERQSPLARFVISKDRGQHVRTPEEYRALASSSFRKIESRTLSDMLRIPYTHFIMRCSKE